MNGVALEAYMKELEGNCHFRLTRTLSKLLLELFQEAECLGCPAYRGVDRLLYVLEEISSNSKIDVTEIERQIVLIGNDVMNVWRMCDEAHYTIFIAARYLVYALFYTGYDNLIYAALQASKVKNIFVGHRDAPDGFAWVHQRLIELW